MFLRRNPASAQSGMIISTRGEFDAGGQGPPRRNTKLLAEPSAYCVTFARVLISIKSAKVLPACGLVGFNRRRPLRPIDSSVDR
jgi:hypothetical protein